MDPSPARNVILSFCHPGTVTTDFMLSVLAASRAKDTPILGVVEVRSGPLLTAARNEQARSFLEDQPDAEWLWMVDTDMVFNPGALPALLESADPETKPVVGGLCMTIMQGQLLPSMYYARRAEDNNGKFTFNPVAQWEPGSLLRVDGTGCACLLVHRSVFKRLNEANPADEGLWFAEMIVDGTLLGEDLSFCLRCAMAEIPVLVNTAVEVGHIKPVTLGQVKP